MILQPNDRKTEEMVIKTKTTLECNVSLDKTKAMQR